MCSDFLKFVIMSQKEYKKMLRKLSLVIFLTIFLQPINCFRQDELANRTNIIDRRRSVSPSYSKDQSIDDLSTSCGSCQMRQDIRNRSLESIKEQILFRLGMQHPLNTTGRKLPQVPLEMLEKIPGNPGMLGDQAQGQFQTGPVISEEEDSFHIKTEGVMAFAKPYPRLRHSWKGHGILYFQFTDKITRNRVKQATMHVWVRGSGERRPSSHDIVIELFKVIRDPSHPETPVTLRKARTIVRQSIGDGHWVRFDTSSLVSEWFKSTKENWGFIINGTLDGQKIITTDSSTDGGNKVPYIEIATSDVKKRRTKRTIGLNCNEETEETLCCRYPLTVDFEEFGWDFIIFPKRYEANYCAGDCPLITLQKYAHTHLLQLTHPATAGPCCTPRKMSAISMLYFDQELNVIFGSLPGMVVERCGCS